MTITRPRLSLRLRIFILTAVALAPALAILGYNEVSLRRSREAEIHALALRFGQSASLEMQGIVSGAEGLLRAIARVPVVRSFDAEPCGLYLADIRRQSPQLAAITVIDRGGSVQCRSAPGAAARLDDRPYFRQALETGGFVVGEYTKSRISAQRGLTLATAIKADDGSIVGVLAAGLDLEWLGGRLRERDLAGGNALTIADRTGMIIAREPFPERFIGTRIPEPFQSLVSGPAPGTREVTSQDGTQRVIGYIPATANPTGLYISAGLSRDEAFAPIDQAMRRGAALALIGSVVALLAAWGLGRRFVRAPVARLMRTIQAWRGGERTARTGMAGGAGELEAVGAAIDGLMDELDRGQAARDAAEEHRRLLLNELNHRVKNTLATVQSIASQTLRNSATVGQAHEALESRLLALSRVHDVLTRESWDGADMGEIVAQALEPFGDSGGKRLRFEGPSVRLSPRAALALSMAFQELATNAVKYGSLSNGTGSVRIRWGLADGPDGHPRLHVRWEEIGGPSVRPPKRRGFGSRLLERALAHDLDGAVTLEFAATGVVCTLQTAAA
ncbi:sensor histidine kinase [Microvirga ossetica]|uniref:sensor histidine kinase n=1 Tax=Microvirga ossetica TaxID=1882682 RepID=UPI000C159DB9|nr:sensor histidine kinase [Microvirga ossetica]